MRVYDLASFAFPLERGQQISAYMDMRGLAYSEISDYSPAQMD